MTAPGTTSSSTLPEGMFEEKKNESKRPPDIKFVQQKLPAYHPVLNAGYVYPWFLLVSILFILLGVGIYFYAKNIQEISHQYSTCRSIHNTELTCEEVLKGALYKPPSNYVVQNKSNGRKECTCRLFFKLDKDMNGTVFMYYALTNFYQNYLKYYTSRDEDQLKGNLWKGKDKPRNASSACEPYDIEDNTYLPILPCGIQANSLFSDVITLHHWYEAGKSRPVALNKTGIAWQSDKEKKFKNSEKMSNIKDPIWQQFGKPFAWNKHLWELDANLSNNGVQNEDFIVWMKTAAFPNFRKLHRIVDSRQSPYEYGLPAGNYSFTIEYNYETPFKGTKQVILTNSRMTAGRNFFLATAYGVTGLILFLLFILFFIIHLLTKNKHFDFKMD